MARNATWSWEGDELVVRIRVDQRAIVEAPPTKLGKSVVVATTDGRAKLDRVVSGRPLGLELNLYAKV